MRLIRHSAASRITILQQFWAFYKLIQPLIDPVTKDKIRFVRDPVEAHDLFDLSQLVSDDFSGEFNFQYDHDTYFRTLDKLCAERREALMQAWRALGGCIGLSEFEVKTYAAKSRTSVNESARPNGAAGSPHTNGHASLAKTSHDPPSVTANGGTGEDQNGPTGLAPEVERRVTEYVDAPLASAVQVQRAAE